MIKEVEIFAFLKNHDHDHGYRLSAIGIMYYLYFVLYACVVSLSLSSVVVVVDLKLKFATTDNSTVTVDHPTSILDPFTFRVGRLIRGVLLLVYLAKTEIGRPQAIFFLTGHLSFLECKCLVLSGSSYAL
jgi:hypothetical protein